MNAKLVILITALVVIGATLLAWRHQRNTLANEMAELNRHYYQTQQRIWRAQATAAAMTAPQPLRRRIERARLALEPAIPRWPVTHAAPWVRAEPTFPPSTAQP